ncbi:MAG: tetratricopeptide repeat protein [Cyclonatronaceae bacterium]
MFLFVTNALQAQDRQQFQQANRLAEQGEYEQAAELYRQLYEQNPESVSVIDRMSAALIQLKEYDEAIDILKTFTERNSGYPNISVRIGEAYHMAGQTGQAMAWWEEMVERYDQNVQVYRLVAESMVQRREHEAAARMYQQARETMGNEQMFGFDIAQNFTAAGMYEESMREYSHLLTLNAGFINAVQRQIARYDDPFFKDIAIMEFEEASREMRPDTDAWKVHREMLIWLYTEQELYRRAAVTAERLEDQLQEQGRSEYPVYELGRQFGNLREFELAVAAYRRYTDSSEHPLFADSRQELANLSIQQARYLLDKNLDFGPRADALYEQAYALLEGLHESMPEYRQMDEVITVLIEISLDHLKDRQRAQQWFSVIQPEESDNEPGEPSLEQQQADPANRQARRVVPRPDSSVIDYLEGRLHMADGEFSRARIALSRANRETSSSAMRNRSRYFLSLNDLYAGDFEYSKLQVKALQRQSSSYYANDALRLRGILQEGMKKDSVLAGLEQFAAARYAFDTGQHEEALQTLSFFVDADGEPELTAPLKPEALLLINRLLRPRAPMVAYLMMGEYIGAGASSPYMERLHWERARLADVLVHAERSEDPGSPKFSIGSELQEEGVPAAFIGMAEKAAGRRAGDISAETEISAAVEPPGVEQLIAHYEALIIEFPNGFYASAARQRIRELEE